MIVVISGSRSITDYSEVCQAIHDSGYAITKIITGGAKGVDALGERYARDHNIPYERLTTPIKGRYAGLVINRELAKLGDALIAIHDGQSRGTADMIRAMKKLNKPVLVRIVGGS